MCSVSSELHVIYTVRTGASALARPREVILGNLPLTLWRRSRSDAIGTTHRRACIEHARLARPFMRSSDFDERRMAP